MTSALENVSMSYEGLVAAGREAREQADNMQWVEGDLALQVEGLTGNERPRDPETGEFLADETKALKRYANDIGVNYSTLQNYRSTARAWPPSLRSDGASWFVHRALNAQEDRFDLIRTGMSVREAEKIVRDRTAGNQGKPGWHELLGHVGDDLAAAAKHLAKFEEAIGDEEVNDALAEKAAKYRGWAEDVAARLRVIGGEAA